MKSEEIVAIIDFLYFGEANVYQENMNSFLAVAEELQLKGLMGSGAEEETEKIYKPTMKKKTKKQVELNDFIKQEVQTPDLACSVDGVNSSLPREGTVAHTEYTVSADLQDLDDKIKSMMEVSENKNDGVQKGFKRICNVCGKEGHMTNIRNHIEANHITGVSHTCNICGTTTRSRQAMTLHKQRKHRAN